MAAESSDKAEVIAFPPLIYGAGLLLGFAIHFVFPVSALPRARPLASNLLL